MFWGNLGLWEIVNISLFEGTRTSQNDLGFFVCFLWFFVVWLECKMAFFFFSFSLS